jgi:hypothetical protein
VGHSKDRAKGKVYSYKCLHLKKTKTSQINNIMMKLKLLEKQEQTKSKTSRWREIKTIRDKINEIETKQTIQRNNEIKN